LELLLAVWAKAGWQHYGGTWRDRRWWR
jgi:hypothetical protein